MFMLVFDTVSPPTLEACQYWWRALSNFHLQIIGRTYELEN